MTSNDFRRLALELPGASESSHMGHPDFRINGKIFATLHYPDENWAMVKLPLEHQDNFMQIQPKVFVPVKGAWDVRAVRTYAWNRSMKILYKKLFTWPGARQHRGERSLQQFASRPKRARKNYGSRRDASSHNC